MYAVTRIVYGDKYLPDLVKLAITVGIGASSSVLLGGVYYGYNSNNRVIDWANVATWGSIGSILASQYFLLKK